MLVKRILTVLDCVHVPPRKCCSKTVVVKILKASRGQSTLKSKRGTTGGQGGMQDETECRELSHHGMLQKRAETLTCNIIRGRNRCFLPENIGVRKGPLCVLLCCFAV